MNPVVTQIWSPQTSQVGVDEVNDSVLRKALHYAGFSRLCDIKGDDELFWDMTAGACKQTTASTNTQICSLLLDKLQKLLLGQPS